MRKSNKLFLLFTAILFLGCFGCFPLYSFNKAYWDEDIMFEKSIIGTWYETTTGDDFKFTIVEHELNTYKVSIELNEHIHNTKGVLFKVGENCFLDLEPFENTDIPHIPLTYMPVHVIVKISWTDDKLMIGLPKEEDIDWLEDIEPDKRLPAVDNFLASETEILFATCSTEALRDYLIKYGSDERAFPEDWMLICVRSLEE